MKKVWHDEAWEDYVYWQTQDRRTNRDMAMRLAL
ncbi:MAG: type II toxin-antitoxin system YoeB family toxin [Lachnospiraceae bacterium]|nr:type II toxin-antitoxin system YoeB family toxin [Lachnospiraceae bacterium]